MDDKKVKFRRNVYIILICVLMLAIVSQIARSQFILNIPQNNSLIQQYKQIQHNLNANEQVKAVSISHEGVTRYCLVFDSMDELSIEVKKNTEQVLSYMKMSYQNIDIYDEEIPYQQCDAILLTVDLEIFHDEYEEIQSYVYNGGKYFIMSIREIGEVFNQIYRKIGITNFNTMESSTGIELTSNLLIGMKGTKFGDDFLYNYSVQAELDDHVEVLSKSTKGIPLMWKTNYGSGIFVVNNNIELNLKSQRGIIAGGISKLFPDFIYPIFNVKLFYIDDFPAPIPQGTKPVIYSDYNLDTPTFFRDIWWPDMIKLTRNYDVKYTAVAIQSYNDQVEGPFREPIDEERHNLISYGREVVKSGGEIGIHGYNHQSLQFNKEAADELGYKIWKSTEDMEESIKEILNYLASTFPNYNVMSYVPPSNVLGPEGRIALKRAWPDLAVIASLYDSDATNQEYIQEYEVASDGVIEMPRVTSGYFDVDYNIWLEANTISSLGVYSHFIHPDDLLDDHRGRGLGWVTLYQDFSNLLKRVQETYPWLRSITSTEAGLDVANLLNTEMNIQLSEDSVHVNSTNEGKPLYFILRTDKKIAQLVNCIVEKADEGIYLVTAYEPDFTIQLGR